MYICMEDESKIYEPVAQVQSNVTIRSLNAELFNDEDVDCIIDCKGASINHMDSFLDIFDPLTAHSNLPKQVGILSPSLQIVFHNSM